MQLSHEAQTILNCAVEKDYGQPTPVLSRRVAGALRGLIQEYAVHAYVTENNSKKWRRIIDVNDVFKIINQLDNHTM